MAGPETTMERVGGGTKKLDSGHILKVKLTDFPDRDWVQGVRGKEESA